MKRTRMLLMILAAASCAWGSVETTSDTISYPCDGSTRAFTFGFGVFSTEDVRVIVRTDATGLATELAENTDYTVTLPNDDGWLVPGGTVTTTTAQASGKTIYIFRQPELSQSTDYSTAAWLNLETLEDDLDRAAVRDRYLDRLISHCLRIPETDDTDCNLPDKIARALTTFTFDADGAPEMVAGLVDLNDVTVSAFWKGILDDANLPDSMTTMSIASVVQSLIQDTNEVEIRDTIGAYPILNITDADYGAVGDGDTNDATAIQNAIDDASAAGGGIIFFPPGTYNIETPLVAANHTSYVGVAGASIIEVNDAGEAAFDFSALGATVTDMIFEGLIFRAEGAGCYAFKASDSSYYMAYCEWRDCEFYAELGYGIVANLASCKLDNCVFGYRGTPGAVWQPIKCLGESGKICFSNSLEHCRFYQAVGAAAAVEVEYGNSWVFVSCIAENLTISAFDFEGVRNVTMLGCNLENVDAVSPDTAIQLQQDGGAANGTYLTMENCKVQNNATDPFDALCYVEGACGLILRNSYLSLGNQYITYDGTSYDAPPDIWEAQLNRVVNYAGSFPVNNYRYSVPEILDPNDTTPSVQYGSAVYLTANTVATTYTDFDDPQDGQRFVLVVGDGNTGFDFTGSGLKGRPADLSAESGDVLSFAYDGSDWYCTGIVGTNETYTESNVSTDRSFDADSTDVAELADVLGTLIVDLRAAGIVD